MRKLIPLLLVVLLIASVLPGCAPQKKVNVVIATQDIVKGTVIEEKMVNDQVQMNEKDKAPGALTSKSDAVGRKTLIKIKKNEIINEVYLAKSK